VESSYVVQHSASPDPTSTSCMALKGELFRHGTQPDPQECACWAARDVHHETALPTILGGERNRGAADARDALTPRASMPTMGRPTDVRRRTNFTFTTH
jgi:hypothetical protein